MPYNIVSCDDFDSEYVSELYDLTSNIMRGKYDSCKLDGYIVGLLFAEPSSRTKLSFEAAVKYLGGDTISLDLNTSSAKKGESLQDTFKTISTYCDILIVRGKKGWAQLATECVDIPVINAGDGSNEHPTQALIDLYTMTKEITHCRFDIALVGDLKESRTIHSLVKLLVKSIDPMLGSINLIPYKGIAKDSFMLSRDLLKLVDDHNLPIRRYNRLEEALRDVNIIYMTRFQTERHTSGTIFREGIVLNRKMLKGHNNTIVLHPLPRGDEIDRDMDKDPRAVYFKQMKYGLYIRMGILYKMIDRFEKRSHGKNTTKISE